MPDPRIYPPRGTLDLLILQTLLLDPQHGWAISGRIQQVGGEVLCIQQRAGNGQVATEKASWIRLTAVMAEVLASA